MIQFILSLFLINSTKTRLKRKWQESFIDPYNSKTLNDRLCCSIPDEVISFTDDQHEQPSAKIKKYDEDFGQLLTWLDQVEFNEPSNEELNEISIVNWDNNLLEEILEDKRVLNYNLKSANTMEITEFIQFNSSDLSCAECSNDKSNAQTDKAQKEHNKIATHDIILYSFLEINNELLNIKTEVLDVANSMFLCDFNDKMKNFIVAYITKNIISFHRSKYFNRLKTLEEIFYVSNKQKLDHNAYFSIFDPSLDTEFCESLNTLNVSSYTDIEFKQETCYWFSKEFDSKIFSSSTLKLLSKKLDKLSYDHKKIFFILAFKKFYKYVADIPELLALGGLLEEKSFCSVLIVFHMIYLFSESVDNIKDHRVFIQYLIYMAFSCFRPNRFDFFLIPLYELSCYDDLHNLTFFTWELHRLMRFNITRRKDMSKYKRKDFETLKTVLLIYLYQNSIFIYPSNLDTECFKIFKEFCVKVITSDDCIGCLFNEYLDKVEILIKFD